MSEISEFLTAYIHKCRLAKRVLVVAPMTFMMTQQRSRTICNPKLIAIFERLEKISRASQIARMRNSIISSDKEYISDRGYNCEVKLHVNIS